MSDDFEKRIQQQSLRKIPGEWRAEILAAANVSTRTTSDVARPGFLSTLNHQLSTIFWPYPKAWAGLAAVWIAIVALNLSTRDHSEMVAKKSAPPSPEMVAELRQQKLLFAELIGSAELHFADRQKSFLPRPRSESAEILAA